MFPLFIFISSFSVLLSTFDSYLLPSAYFFSFKLHLSVQYKLLHCVDIQMKVKCRIYVWKIRRILSSRSLVRNLFTSNDEYTLRPPAFIQTAQSIFSRIYSRFIVILVIGLKNFIYLFTSRDLDKGELTKIIENPKVYV